MESLRKTFRRLSPKRGNETFNNSDSHSEVQEAHSTDDAMRKWLKLEHQREQARAEALQNSLTAAQRQAVHLGTRARQLEGELQRREQQLLQQGLQYEQDKHGMLAQLEQQGGELLRLQQELDQVQQLWQQEQKSAATHKASATVAWDRFEGIVRQLTEVIIQAAAALKSLNKSRGQLSSSSEQSEDGLPKAADVLQAVLLLWPTITQDEGQTENCEALASQVLQWAADIERQLQQQQQHQHGPCVMSVSATLKGKCGSEATSEQKQKQKQQQQQQQALDSFKQQYCNPVWSEWSNLSL